MKKKKQNKVPSILIAVRRGNREAERILLGDGFHVKVKVVKSKKVYNRKQKHPKESGGL